MVRLTNVPACVSGCQKQRNADNMLLDGLRRLIIESALRAGFFRRTHKSCGIVTFRCFAKIHGITASRQTRKFVTACKISADVAAFLVSEYEITESEASQTNEYLMGKMPMEFVFDSPMASQDTSGPPASFASRSRGSTLYSS